MGGFGSGRHGGKDCTGDMRQVDVRRLHRDGDLKPGMAYNRQWTRNGEVISSIACPCKRIGCGSPTGTGQRAGTGRTCIAQPMAGSHAMHLRRHPCMVAVPHLRQALRHPLHRQDTSMQALLPPGLSQRARNHQRPGDAAGQQTAGSIGLGAGVSQRQWAQAQGHALAHVLSIAGPARRLHAADIGRGCANAGAAGCQAGGCAARLRPGGGSQDAGRWRRGNGPVHRIFTSAKNENQGSAIKQSRCSSSPKLSPDCHQEKSALSFNSALSFAVLVGPEGFEPSTNGLRVRCSTN